MAMVDDFKTRFPEFDSDNVDELFPLIEDDLPLFYGADYGNNDFDDRVLLMLTAHLFALETKSNAGKTGANNEIASKSTGNVSVSYNLPTDSSSSRLFFSTTAYGQRFLIMIKRNAPGGLFV